MMAARVAGVPRPFSRMASRSSSSSTNLPAPSFALECIFLDPRDASGYLKLRCGEKNSDETAHDHVVNFLLRFIESVRRLPTRDNRKVIGDFRVIENPFGRLDPAIIQRFTCKLIFDLAQCRSDRRNIIFRQVAGISARIGDHFEALIKLLRDLQGALCAEPASIRFPLQTGEIIKQWRRLRRWFAFFCRDAGFIETVSFRSSDGCLCQRYHFLIRAEVLKVRADRFACHRLEPETLDWMFAPAQLHQIPEDKLTFAPGVAGID